jgi:chromosomal replication initiator protein
LSETLWNRCLRVLESELPMQQFNTWVRPLQVVERDGEIRLLAPNRYVVAWLGDNSLPRIKELIREFADGATPDVVLDVGTRAGTIPEAANAPVASGIGGVLGSLPGKTRRSGPIVIGGRIAPEFTFDSFVEGKSNQLAKAAAVQVAGNPGRSYNPLFIYGGVGLGKTHLMHAVANKIKEHNADARIAYVHSERFVSDMVKALQHNTINDFKTAYRTLDALMIDDIQFFAKKDRSHLQRTAREPAASDPDVRPLPQGSGRARGAVEIALRLGVDRRDRAAGARDLRRYPHEQGGDRQC